MRHPDVQRHPELKTKSPPSWYNRKSNHAKANAEDKAEAKEEETPLHGVINPWRQETYRKGPGQMTIEKYKRKW